MKYTKNTPLKLKALGFEFSDLHEPEPTDEAHYEVWTKGFIEITVDHLLKQVFVNIRADDEELEIKHWRELKTLDRIINQKSEEHA